MISPRKGAKRKHTMAKTWWKPLTEEYDTNSLTVMDLLKFASKGSQNRRRELLAQILVGLGEALDCVVVDCAGGAPVPGLTADLHALGDELNLAQRTSQYWQGTCDRVTQTPVFLQVAPDKSRVGTLGVMACPFSAPANFSGWCVPQDSRNQAGRLESHPSEAFPGSWGGSCPTAGPGPDLGILGKCYRRGTHVHKTNASRRPAWCRTPGTSLVMLG